jgi:hypothetical protein
VLFFVLLFVAKSNGHRIESLACSVSFASLNFDRTLSLSTFAFTASESAALSSVVSIFCSRESSFSSVPLPSFAQEVKKNSTHPIIKALLILVILTGLMQEAGKGNPLFQKVFFNALKGYYF